MVSQIRPFGSIQWKISSINKPTKEVITTIYDAVIICNGHYNDPIIPILPNQEKFKGLIAHSHTYRCPKPFKGLRVLVIGAGPSGLDIALQLSSAANYVVLSHHTKEAVNTQYPKNVIKKPDVIRVRDAEGVEFVDGSCMHFDAILFCTGYRYSFPFLHRSCGVTVDENHIQPLYKHMIHIEKPSMCFIGIPFNVCAFQMFDLQVCTAWCSTKCDQKVR